MKFAENTSLERGKVELVSGIECPVSGDVDVAYASVGENVDTIVLTGLGEYAIKDIADGLADVASIERTV